ncbi:juvenile hormone esterase-like [Euwallacea fornicatus]|uniref:juvenile hormone esterase-like n=1 Tax=Euwallacea fornicatus TaxID=995702 RepID=UPI00338F6077
MLSLSLLLCGLIQVTYQYCGEDTCNPSLDYYDPLVRDSGITPKGNTFFSFNGIPYAKPPVGALRFQNPQELEKSCCHSQVKGPPACIQKNYLFSDHPEIEGQEDCLYLNVHVPEEVCTSGSTTKAAVMVFIHWGAFIAGQSSPDYLGPSYLMDEGIIVVTFNYRLGPFGFLSTLDDEAPGNYALKDQVLVLKWVKENIGAFGGDNLNVTIFGQSAGAACVHYHMLRPESAVYFNRAISQSGNALALWATPFNAIQRNVTDAQANFVGCGNITNNQVLMNCLRNVPAEEFMDSQDKFKVFYTNPLVVFGPVIEKRTCRNREPFLTKMPLEYILSGELAKIPWMTGVTKNEGNIMAAPLVRSSRIRQLLNAKFEKTLSNILLLFQLSTTDVKGLYKSVLNFYFKGEEDVNNRNTIKGLVNLYSDRTFIYPMYQSLEVHLKQAQTPIYLYSFEYEGQNSYLPWFSNTNETIDFHWDTTHCDELIYLFKSPALFYNQINRRSTDGKVRSLLTNMWANFAKFGDPNPTVTPIRQRWNPLSGKKELCCSCSCSCRLLNEAVEVLRFTGDSTRGINVTVSKGFYKERMEFWQNRNILENANVTCNFESRKSKDYKSTSERAYLKFFID